MKKKGSGKWKNFSCRFTFISKKSPRTFKNKKEIRRIRRTIKRM
jgi:hypothetical protein